jgi:segregation and condensation protein B
VEERLLKAILESLLFAAGEPVTLARLGNALESVPRETIRQALTEMTAAYLNDGRGLVLEAIAGGYQLRTPSEHAPYIRRLLSAKPPRLSRPLLETLSIIAYRRQVTRPEIEQLRGVDTGGVLETLLERTLIRIAGRKDAPGRPMFYETTPGFLELFGLKTLEELPDLEEFRAIEGTLADALAGSVEQAEMAPPSEAATDEFATIKEVVDEINFEITQEPQSASDAATDQPDELAAPKRPLP